MKLKNKKTGEILEVVAHRAGDYRDKFDSLAELNEEWEDYEEPKNYFYLTAKGNIHNIEDLDDEGDEQRKDIGNYFSSREEAQKVVEKLKAWKRLKDKGFRFNGIRFRDDNYIRWNIEPIKTITDDEAKEITDDVHLIFGGSDDN